MYELMVSYDCGMSYDCEAKADNPEDFKDRCKELNAQMLRWVIEKDGKLEGISAIHKNILNFMHSKNIQKRIENSGLMP